MGAYLPSLIGLAAIHYCLRFCYEEFAFCLPEFEYGKIIPKSSGLYRINSMTDGLDDIFPWRYSTGGWFDFPEGIEEVTSENIS